MRTPVDVAVVGAGFSGATLARCLAEAGRSVVVVDRRPHVGGNAADGVDAHGVFVHYYGPHLFHTNSERVWRWLSRFTTWRPYAHRVLARQPEGLLPFPINRHTLHALYGSEVLATGVEGFLARVRVPIDHPQNAEEQVVSRLGWDLYRRFFEPYTRKQWGRDPKALAASVTARIPVRLDDEDRYFTDRFQGIPTDGYTALVTRLLDHPLIRVVLRADWEDAALEWHWRRLLYTGPLDAFFGYRYGPLPYRSLAWRWTHEPVDRVQPVATINDPGHPTVTRTTEFTHLTGQTGVGSTLVAEMPTDYGEPYYPIPAADTAALLGRYEAAAATLPHVAFFGRLGRYRYYNMDQVVAEALTAFPRLRAAGW